VTAELIPLSEQFAKHRHRERWLLERRAPPRCLTCGSIEVFAIDEAECISHPGFDGELPRELGMRSKLE
jgi:hypothetical protein